MSAPKKETRCEKCGRGFEVHACCDMHRFTAGGPYEIRGGAAVSAARGARPVYCADCVRGARFAMRGVAP